MDKAPQIINITGKIPNSDDSHELQSIYPLGTLLNSLGIYLARSLKNHDPLPIKHFQDVLNRKANEVEELKALSFEPNQRVGELVALVSLVAAINKINAEHKAGPTDFAPAWQKAGQNESIERFTGKGSWDGFIYEHVPLGTENPDVKVVMTGVEIKSLMINPNAAFTNLNELLSERISEFSKHFQVEGSIAVILVPPYSNELHNKISFDLKQATEDINNNVANPSALVFISTEDSDDVSVVATRTYLVLKSPKIVDGNIDHIEMVRVPFCRFK